ncbi:MAG: rhomboid family intramembrane serine protease [Leptolyngbyaceae cyanobacterium CRU_2_3]|nr:rhomboid family intramembrane serine protease [Leptolyngbyaceae cyanobacterium CRU_2_3]
MSLSYTDLIEIRAQARVLLGLTAIAWLIHWINWGLLGGWLNRAFGLRPRTFWGLVGIACSPFLHVKGSHLPGNTRVFLLLGWFVLLLGMHLFYIVTIAIALFSGIGVWLFGKSRGLYVGASGITYGYRGFLLIYGITAGDAIAFILAIVSGFLYRDRILGSQYASSGILPGHRVRMAWDGHLFGFGGGILVGLLLSDMRLS